MIPPRRQVTRGQYDHVLLARPTGLAGGKQTVGSVPLSTASSTMPLQDLAKYATGQTAKINNHMAHPVDAVLPWTRLRDSLWGKGLASLESSPQELQKLLSLQDEDPLPDITPTTHLIVKIPETMPNSWSLRSQHLLVRPEYEEAEEAALSASLNSGYWTARNRCTPSRSVVAIHKTDP